MEENIKAPITRTEAREYVFALLFARAFAPDEAADEFYAREMENAEIEFGDQIDYVHDVFFGITDTLSQIDEKIASAASGWSLGRLSKASLAIMRLSTYEMTAVDDVPKKVALNEAVELAKKFDDDNAPSFINGVLNTIAHSLPERECDK
ncbi:MAG: transcription antitermination factor NusB [Clostridia bacterium]|nr:transcription antitermination factor NusB [Clostridia bacterium]